MKGKKGSIIFLIVFFGIFVAVGIFLMGVVKDNLDREIKGEWHVTFLNENYLESQKQLLKYDITAKNFGSKIALELAENGGFESGKKSTCGQVSGVNLWNDETKWCFPKVEETVSKLTTAELKNKFPNKEFLEISYSKDSFFSKGSKETITSDAGSYTFNAGFAVNLGYSFTEYDQLKKDIMGMMVCRNENDLVSCLDGKKPNYWKYSSCENEVRPSSGDKQIVFCVHSPKSGTVYINEAILPILGNLQSSKNVVYNMALDFTATGPTIVIGTSVKKVQDKYEISFDEIPGVNAYKIYVTDRESLDYAGVPGDFVVLGDQFIESFVVTDILPCAAQKDVNQMYLCGDKLVYVFSEDLLSDDQKGRSAYYFAATSVKEGKESEINGFVSS